MIEDAYVDAGFAWASEKIMELDEEWTVVLFTHGYEPGTAKSTEIAKRLLKLQGEAAAEIAIWINGHYHDEQNEILYDDEGNKLRRVVINADAINYTAHYKMTVGTSTEQSFSFFQVDTKNEVIYLTRVGAGDDKVFNFGSKLEAGTENFHKISVKVQNG